MLATSSSPARLHERLTRAGLLDTGPTAKQRCTLNLTGLTQALGAMVDFRNTRGRRHALLPEPPRL